MSWVYIVSSLNNDMFEDESLLSWMRQSFRKKLYFCFGLSPSSQSILQFWIRLYKKYLDFLTYFISRYLMPDHSKSSKKKTAVMKRSLNPEFHEEFVYNIPRNIVHKRSLEVTVWNHSLPRNTFLGESYLYLINQMLWKQCQAFLVLLLLLHEFPRIVLEVFHYCEPLFREWDLDCLVWTTILPVGSYLR